MKEILYCNSYSKIHYFREVVAIAPYYGKCCGGIAFLFTGNTVDQYDCQQYILLYNNNLLFYMCIHVLLVCWENKLCDELTRKLQNRDRWK